MHVALMVALGPLGPSQRSFHIMVDHGTDHAPVFSFDVSGFPVYGIGDREPVARTVLLSRGEMAMMCRGVRGATTVEENSREAILRGARQLLALMIRRNGIAPQDVASAIFSITSDLDAEFPALAARQLGWLDVPLLCTNEVPVRDSLPQCIRILVNWNTDKSQRDIVHVYIREAIQLRPDLCKLPPVDYEELESWIAEYMNSSDAPRR